MEGIEYIVWDVDKTLYKGTPEIDEAFLNYTYKIIQEKFNLKFEEAEDLFEKKREETGSFTQTLIDFGLEGKINEIMENVKYEGFLEKDEKLIKMFDSLKDYKHAIISNGTKKTCNSALTVLGLSQSIFEIIITREDVEKSKPDEEPFRKLLEKTGLPPEKHVYIGDRDRVDIATPKKLGMKTIFVWGKSKIADISLPTVYGVLKVLEKNK